MLVPAAFLANVLLESPCSQVIALLRISCSLDFGSFRLKGNTLEFEQCTFFPDSLLVCRIWGLAKEKVKEYLVVDKVCCLTLYM